MSIKDKFMRAKADYDEVHEAGKSAEWNAFWDGIQNCGTRTVYARAFAYTTLNDETFKPKYDMKPTDAYYMFFMNIGITDLKNLDVTLDFSQAEDIRFAFYGMSKLEEGKGIRRIGVVDARAETHGVYAFDGMFNWDVFLEEIEKIILKSDGSQGFNSTFNACYALREIRFEGVIGQNINFVDCPLSRESIENIVGALSPSASGKTLTLNASAVANAFTDAEWNALKATKPNWNFSV